MKNTSILNAEVIAKFDSILKRGLCHGVGTRDGQMCIEAAICYALDLPHGDELSCVEPAIRRYKIRLNNATWSSPQARAVGLRNLGIAQIGSSGVVSGEEFVKLLSKRTIQILIPTLFREVFTRNTPKHKECIRLAELCESEGTAHSAYTAATAATDAAADAAFAAYTVATGAATVATYTAATGAIAAATDAATYTATYTAATYTAATAATDAATYAAAAENTGDKYLLLSASIALGVLRDLKSPGCEWL